MVGGSRRTRVRIDLDDVDQRMGIKLEDEVGYWFPAAEQEAAAASYRRHYVRLAPDLTFLLPGAEEALAAVRRAGERAVIITAKHPVSVRPSLEAVGLVADEHIYACTGRRRPRSWPGWARLST